MVTVMTEPLVVEAIRQFKAQLLIREAAQMQEMTRQWLQVEAALDAEITALTHEIAAMREAGKSIPQWRIFEMGRYQRLVLQTRQEIEQYTRWAERLIIEQQRYHVGLGIEHAGRAIQTSFWEAGRLAASFDVLPASALEYMVGFAGDGSPLHSLLSAASLDSVEGLTAQLVKGTALGWNPNKTARFMQQGLSGGLQRAITIARTEQLRAYRTASQSQYAASGLVESHVRVAAHDDRTCMACLMADGEVLGVNEVLYDHTSGRCLAPSTFAGGPPVEALVSRRYKGDIVTVSLASGQFVSVTPNHPILTDRGWVAANLLCQGDNVVCCGFLDGATSNVRPDEYQVPTVVKDIPGTLGMSRLTSVPCSAENFHGDGEGSNIYVVWANGLLRDRIQATFNQPAIQQLLRNGGMGTSTLVRFGNFTAMLNRLRSASTGFLGDLNAAMMLLYRNLTGRQLIGLGLAAAGHAGYAQAPSYNAAGNAKMFSNGILGFTGQIAGRDFVNGDARVRHCRSDLLDSSDTPTFFLAPEQPASLEFIREAILGSVKPSGGNLSAVAADVGFDSVLEIGVRAFEGHVYNLQTTTGWYNASNSIAHNGSCVKMPIVHNCSSAPQVSGLPALKFDKLGRDWFLEQDADTQRDMLGPGRYEAWQAGKFDLDQMVTHTSDSTWGRSLSPTPLSELAA